MSFLSQSGNKATELLVSLANLPIQKNLHFNSDFHCNLGFNGIFFMFLSVSIKKFVFVIALLAKYLEN